MISAVVKQTNYKLSCHHLSRNIIKIVKLTCLAAAIQVSVLRKPELMAALERWKIQVVIVTTASTITTQGIVEY
jgi:hypothetical protein